MKFCENNYGTANDQFRARVCEQRMDRRYSFWRLRHHLKRSLSPNKQCAVRNFRRRRCIRTKAGDAADQPKDARRLQARPRFMKKPIDLVLAIFWDSRDLDLLESTQNHRLLSRFRSSRFLLKKGTFSGTTRFSSGFDVFREKHRLLDFEFEIKNTSFASFLHLQNTILETDIDRKRSKLSLGADRLKTPPNLDPEIGSEVSRLWCRSHLTENILGLCFGSFSFILHLQFGCERIWTGLQDPRNAYSFWMWDNLNWTSAPKTAYAIFGAPKMHMQFLDVRESELDFRVQEMHVVFGCEITWIELQDPRTAYSLWLRMWDDLNKTSAPKNAYAGFGCERTWTELQDPTQCVWMWKNLNYTSAPKMHMQFWSSKNAYAVFGLIWPIVRNPIGFT